MLLKIITKIGIVVSSFFVLSINIYASDYLRGNVNLGYSQFDYRDYKRKALILDSTIYVSPVKKINHPWLEAAFLGRASSIAVTAMNLEAESTNNVVGQDGNRYSIGGRYASTRHPVIVKVAYSYSKLTFDRFPNVSPTSPLVTTRNDSYSLSVGSYLGSNTELVANYTRDKSENTNGVRNTDFYGISVRSVLVFSNGQALTMSGDIGRRNYKNSSSTGQTTNYYHFTPIYYFTQTLSIELPLAVTNGDFDYSDEKRIGVGFHGFIGQHFSAELSYIKGFPDESSRENNSVAILTAYVWF